MTPSGEIEKKVAYFEASLRYTRTGGAFSAAAIAAIALYFRTMQDDIQLPMDGLAIMSLIFAAWALAISVISYRMHSEWIAELRFQDAFPDCEHCFAFTLKHEGRFDRAVRNIAQFAIFGVSLSSDGNIEDFITKRNRMVNRIAIMNIIAFASLVVFVAFYLLGRMP